MTNYKRPAVVFNLDNPSHKDLYDWCTGQSRNFSDFARTILFHYKQVKTSNLNFSNTGGENLSLKPILSSDASAMSELL